MNQVQGIDLREVVIYKPNILIEASYRLSVLEQHLIHKLTGRIKREDKDFEEYIFNVSDLIEEFGLSKGSGYNEIERAAESLLKKPLMIVDDDRRLFINFVSSAEYINQSAKLILCFDPKLKPYLLQLQGRFKILQQKILFNLKRQYAIRIYELLKQYENMPFNKKEEIKTRRFDYEDLREYLALNKNRRLDIKEDMYCQWFNFKRIVLEPAIEEILQKDTDIKELWYERVPKRGKVQSIIFKYSVGPVRKRERLQSSYTLEEEQLEADIFLSELLREEQFLDNLYLKIRHSDQQKRDIISKAIKLIGLENWRFRLDEWYASNCQQALQKASKSGVSEKYDLAVKSYYISIYFKQLIPLVRKEIK